MLCNTVLVVFVILIVIVLVIHSCFQTFWTSTCEDRTIRKVEVDRVRRIPEIRNSELILNSLTKSSSSTETVLLCQLHKRWAIREILTINLPGVKRNHPLSTNTCTT